MSLTGSKQACSLQAMEPGAKPIGPEAKPPTTTPATPGPEPGGTTQATSAPATATSKTTTLPPSASPAKQPEKASSNKPVVAKASTVATTNGIGPSSKPVVDAPTVIPAVTDKPAVVVSAPPAVPVTAASTNGGSSRSTPKLASTATSEISDDVDEEEDEEDRNLDDSTEESDLKPLAPKKLVVAPKPSPSPDNNSMLNPTTGQLMTPIGAKSPKGPKSPKSCKIKMPTMELVVPIVPVALSKFEGMVEMENTVAEPIYEEDIIDGFSFAAFKTYDDLEVQTYFLSISHDDLAKEDHNMSKLVLHFCHNCIALLVLKWGLLDFSRATTSGSSCQRAVISLPQFFQTNCTFSSI